MKYKKIAETDINASRVALGCMRIAHMPKEELNQLIKAALTNGIDFFDHADIYGGGQSEEVFGEAIDKLGIKRDHIYLQSKCGIRKGFYDLSKSHILSSVDESLKRLHTDYLDVLLLHRPDALLEPEEIAQAFDTLRACGKVRYFGVSNFNPMQIELLKKVCQMPLVIDQLQLSVTNTTMIDAGINVNIANEKSTDHDGSVLDYLRLSDMTLQAWSPFQYGTFSGTFIDHEDFPQLNAELLNLAARYSVSKNAIAIAFLLRHPAQMQTIVGTTNVKHLSDACAACDVELTREEWYALYRSAGNLLP